MPLALTHWQPHYHSPFVRQRKFSEELKHSHRWSLKLTLKLRIAFFYLPPRTTMLGGCIASQARFSHPQHNNMAEWEKPNDKRGRHESRNVCITILNDTSYLISHVQRRQIQKVTKRQLPKPPHKHAYSKTQNPKRGYQHQHLNLG